MASHYHSLTYPLSYSLPHCPRSPSELSSAGNWFISTQNHTGPSVWGPLRRFCCFQIARPLTEHNYVVRKIAGNVTKGKDCFFFMVNISMELVGYFHLMARKPGLGIHLPKGSFASNRASVSSPFKALWFCLVASLLIIAPKVAAMSFLFPFFFFRGQGDGKRGTRQESLWIILAICN